MKINPKISRSTLPERDFLFTKTKLNGVPNCILKSKAFTKQYRMCSFAAINQNQRL